MTTPSKCETIPRPSAISPMETQRTNIAFLAHVCLQENPREKKNTLTQRLSANHIAHQSQSTLAQVTFPVLDSMNAYANSSSVCLLPTRSSSVVAEEEEEEEGKEEDASE